MRTTIAAIVSVFLAGPAWGQVVLFDSFGFEPAAGYALGDLNGQNGWSVVSPPGTFAVQNGLVKNGAQAVSVTGGVSNNWAYPTINYSPTPGEIIRIQGDIARNPFINEPVSFGFGIDVYTTMSAQTTRFGLTLVGANVFPFVTSRYMGGMFNPAGPVTDVVIGGAIPGNTFVSFDARLNYVSKSLRLLINGVDVGSDIPFVSLAAANLGHADWNVTTDPGATDMGFLDNYIVSTQAIPEPASIVLLGLTSAICGVRRSWRRK